MERGQVLSPHFCAEDYMQFSFWRYQLILVLLFIVWGQFFTAGTLANQVAFNFAVFYPVGFLGGYRKEKKFYLFGAALVFNTLTYLLALLNGVLIEGWLIVSVDFISLFILMEVGFYIGNYMYKK
ncbi:MAG: hypothetical protein ACYDEJ_07595 [Desulfitobacteriaceae bacterium]